MRQGLAEAATRPTMRLVELKSQDRLDLQTLHRARLRLVAARKALLNQLRTILLERGHTFREGRKVLEREIDPFLADLNEDLSKHPRTDAAASRLLSIPGIGVLGATELFAAVEDGGAFRRARDLPAWLGLVPKQMTTAAGRGCWVSPNTGTCACC